MTIIDEIRAFYSFFQHVSIEDKSILVLFASMECLLLLFYWLWLNERKYRHSHLRLDNKESMPSAEPMANASLMSRIKLPSRVSLGKVALKASKIASVIFPSTQKTKIPDAIETNQASQPTSPVSVTHEKEVVNHN